MPVRYLIDTRIPLGPRAGLVDWPRGRIEAAVFEPWQAELLSESRVARLATIAANGEPQTVPVCFVAVEGSIAIAIDEKPKGPIQGLARLRKIARDPRVTLLVDHYEDEDWELLAVGANPWHGESPGGGEPMAGRT